MTTPHPLIDQRIRLLAMPHEPHPLPIGSTGTVVSVYEGHDWLQLRVKWDTPGLKLALAVPPDEYEIISGGEPCTG